MIILHIGSSRAISQVTLRYGGCFGHGLDDGSSLWSLTRPAMAPFIAGPNQISTRLAADLPRLFAAGRMGRDPLDRDQFG